MPLYPAPQAFTAGSIAFGGTNGLLTQDNAQLFWDDTNNRLGLGTVSPVVRIHAESDAAEVFLNIVYVGSAGGAGFQGRKARGSKSAPRRALLDDTLANMNAFGAIAADNVTDATFPGVGGQFLFLAGEDQQAASRGTRWVLRLVPTGSSTIADKLVAEGDGRLYGTGLHNSAGAVTGAANQYIASGTYTPTLTNVTNLAASTSYVAQWMRVGNVVTVSGRVDIDPTAAGSCQLGMSLPIASLLANIEDCAGSANSSGIAGQSAAIRADATNDRAEMVWIAVDISNQAMYYTYTYEVL